ncbi:dihydrofolate reductase family protein [Sphingosinicella sp. LHD-64]|uniref:dihydrofolate reductase family protein n=1 Tax=Sphingosinicella sp. LHD-64 TaxID=3072139 RepID=UPI00280CD7DB|nr:dihydrofolate reductase family protein [Sphingosinicella sp. LHD-64]MDQ8758093.1 dihydrofolate reductase family protein [Sphingosinicella sp. LHD-64]
MSKLTVSAFTVSVDGYGAGPDQSVEHPLGRGTEHLHDWLIPTRTFQQLSGREGDTGIDDGFAQRSFENVGAWIMGRNMFGPVRGAWPDESWRGWWGENPPYHVPVFVLTHHARPPLEMAGDTVFHFITGGIREALDRARAAARDKDIRIGGGASTVRQYLEADLIDEMHLAVSPILLGRGEPLFAGIDLLAKGFAVTEHVTSERAMHIVLTKGA